MTKPFQRYEAGAPADHPVKYVDHAADNLDEPMHFTLSEGDDPDFVPDAPFHDLAALAVASLPSRSKDRLRQVDPALLLALAKIIANLVLDCTEAKLASTLIRVKVRPHGLLALVIKARIKAQLPARFGHPEDRDVLADALLTAGVKATDDPALWDRVFPK